jgi:hypothetical protein
VLRKPFISLARMVLWPEIYSRGDMPFDEGEPLTSEKESHAELMAAQYIIKYILESCRIELEDIRPRRLEDCQWLAESTTAWQDAGTELIEIPDMRDVFAHNRS